MGIPRRMVVWHNAASAAAVALCLVIAVVQLTAPSTEALLASRNDKKPYFHGMRKFERLNAAHKVMSHKPAMRAAVAAGQGSTVGWSHYQAAPRQEYGAELPATGNSWAQLGHGNKGNVFTASGQASRRFEEPVRDPFGTDSSFMNKGDNEGVTMKAPLHTSMLTKSKKPYFHGMRKLEQRKQQLRLKPVQAHKQVQMTNKLVNYQEKKPFFHKKHTVVHSKKAAAAPVIKPVHKVGVGFKF